MLAAAEAFARAQWPRLQRDTVVIERPSVTNVGGKATTVYTPVATVAGWVNTHRVLSQTERPAGQGLVSQQMWIFYLDAVALEGIPILERDRLTLYAGGAGDLSAAASVPTGKYQVDNAGNARTFKGVRRIEALTRSE